MACRDGKLVPYEPYPKNKTRTNKICRKIPPAVIQRCHKIFTLCNFCALFSKILNKLLDKGGVLLYNNIYAILRNRRILL